MFAPVGIFLMWRYQPWPRRVKVALTAFGIPVWIAGTYVSSTYIMPQLF